MSRGGKWLCAGVALVLGSLVAGELIARAAMDSFQNARGPRDAFDTVNSLSPFATVANLAFYGGILAFVIGVVLMIVDGGQPAGAPEPRRPDPFPPRPTGTAAEEENERLRAEVERLRRERASDHDAGRR